MHAIPCWLAVNTLPVQTRASLNVVCFSAVEYLSYFISVCK
jgi:hypothetical protein